MEENINNNSEAKRMEYIGKKIKELRKERKITQSALAKLIGKTASSIQKYEYGTTKIPFDVLEKIAKIFNKDIKYFFPQSRFEEYLDSITTLSDRFGTSCIELKMIEIKNYIIDEMMNSEVEAERAFEIVEDLKKYFDFLIAPYKRK